MSVEDQFLDGVKDLVRLILEDEERHHQVFAEMANAHPLLVELMRHDTAKHIAILEHITARLSGH